MYLVGTHEPGDGSALAAASSAGVAAALAGLFLHAGPTLLVDLAGGSSAVHCAVPYRSGRQVPADLSAWLQAPAPPPDALRRIASGRFDELQVLIDDSRVSSPVDERLATGVRQRLDVLFGLLEHDERPVVVHVGGLLRLREVDRAQRATVIVVGPATAGAWGRLVAEVYRPTRGWPPAESTSLVGRRTIALGRRRSLVAAAGRCGPGRRAPRPVRRMQAVVG